MLYVTLTAYFVSNRDLCTPIWIMGRTARNCFRLFVVLRAHSFCLSTVYSVAQIIVKGHDHCVKDTTHISHTSRETNGIIIARVAVSVQYLYMFICFRVYMRSTCVSISRPETLTTTTTPARAHKHHTQVKLPGRLRRSAGRNII